MSEISNSSGPRLPAVPGEEPTCNHGEVGVAPVEEPTPTIAGEADSLLNDVEDELNAKVFAPVECPVEFDIISKQPESKVTNQPYG